MPEMTEMRNKHQLSPNEALKMACGGFLLLCLANVGAQTPSSQAPVPEQNSVSTPAVQAAPPSKAWQQLTPRQKQALAPLGAQWSALTAQQQIKWLTISENFTQLTVADQITMHARMADWVGLSPQQRNLARLNFNKLQNLPKEDKKAKWEAYQALTIEERRLFSEGSATIPKSAARTAKPLEAHREVQIPSKQPSGNPTAASTVDRKTLLPRPPALATPTLTAPSQPQPGSPESARQATETAPS